MNFDIKTLRNSKRISGAQKISKKFSRELKKSEDLGLFLGMFAGDGCLTIGHNGFGYRTYPIVFVNTNKAYVKLFRNLFYNLFQIKGFIYLRKRKNKKDLWTFQKCSLEIYNTINKEFELSNNIFEESSKYENRFNMRLPSNISAKTYPITITAGYGSEKEIENINLVVSECEKKEATEKTEEAKESEEVTDIQLKEPPQEEEVEVGKEKESKEIPEIEEKLDENLLLFLSIALGILVLVIIALFVMFWFVRK